MLPYGKVRYTSILSWIVPKGLAKKKDYYLKNNTLSGLHIFWFFWDKTVETSVENETVADGIRGYKSLSVKIFSFSTNRIILVAYVCGWIT